MRRCSQVRSAKGLELAGFGTPVELDPFSETTTLRSFEGVINKKDKLHIITISYRFAATGC